MYGPFNANHFLLRKQAIALTGIFRIYDDSGMVIAYSKQKMFKLREDIRVFTDENQGQELLYIQARQILDFSAAYDVYDSLENRKIGALRRRGLKSILMDQWDVLDAGDQVIGMVTEDSMSYALLRRLLLGRLLPQNYDLLIGDQKVMDLRQRFSLFHYELDLDFGMASGRGIDHRMGIAAGILLAAIEGKQES